jgi:alkyldihydroxyacetonephosphate synthase
MYPDGASMYITYLWRLGGTPEQTLARWTAMKTAASQQILAHGGTISHQHGIGTDHAPYLSAEKGPLGMQAIRAALRTFDPDGLMNPGKLIATP